MYLTAGAIDELEKSRSTHPPSTADNDQPRLPLHIALHLVLLIIQIHLEDWQVLLPAFPRLQRQSVRRHPIDMTLGIGESVMEQDDARE